MSTDLASFQRDLVQDVLATAEATDTTLPDAFTQRIDGVPAVGPVVVRFSG